MPEYEISWQVFGLSTITADNVDEAIEELKDEVLPWEYDGLDYEIEEV